MSLDLELTGRRALVTAGTRGVGAAVVDVLRNAGAIVVGTGGPRLVGTQTGYWQAANTQYRAELRANTGVFSF